MLAALVASLMVGDQGIMGLTPSPELIALAGAIVVVWKTRNMTWTLLPAWSQCGYWGRSGVEGRISQRVAAVTDPMTATSAMRDVAHPRRRDDVPRSLERAGPCDG